MRLASLSRARLWIALACIPASIVTVTLAADMPPPVFSPPRGEKLVSVALPDLRIELLWMSYEDQQARSSGGCGGQAQDEGGTAAPALPDIGEVDRTNTERLKAIVEEHGWPTVAMVGRDGARSAWLLAQHADHDVEWQKTCLGLMQQQEEKGQARSEDLAYLTDRVRVNEGRPQLYGTQFHSVDGVRKPRPIENPEQVDDRREAMGMTSLAAYEKFVNT